MNFNLQKATVFLVLSGSRAYGCETEDSDWDYRGICIPPHPTYFIGSRFEQIVDTDKNKHVWKHYPEGFVQPNSDMQVMELTKFVRLAIDNNPSIIEILFSDDDSIVYKDPIIQPLLDQRQKFLSKRAKARFAAYGISQLKRIERHKRWLDNPPKEKPNREDFGLPPYSLLSVDQLGAAEAIIKREVDAFSIDQTDLPEHTKINLSTGLGRMMRAVWSALHADQAYPIGRDQKFDSTEHVLAEAIMRQEGFSENFIEILRKERKYRAAKQEWDSYQHWLNERNPARAAMEKKYGYDLKHASQCYRLLTSAREILEFGTLHVKRPDADIIREIRSGAWTYERVCEFAEKQEQELNELAKKSNLPDHPHEAFINDIVYGILVEFHKRN